MTGTNSNKVILKPRATGASTYSISAAERYEAELVLEMARAINRGETGGAEMIRSMVQTSISERLAKNGPKNEQKDTGDNHERDINEAAPILKP